MKEPMHDDEEMMTLHKESALMQIATWSKVVGWALLVIYLIIFLGQFNQVLTAFNAGQLPTDALGLATVVANLVYLPATGAFYFLILQGLAQGLYIASDLFAVTEDVEDM